MFPFQKNEVASSTVMEYAAFQQCTDFLMGHAWTYLRLHQTDISALQNT